MASVAVVGFGVGAASLGARQLIKFWQAFKAAPRIRKFYPGGFQPTMTRREAGLILGLRESGGLKKVSEAHRRVMMANHPDAGGSHYLASKINEAKEMMLGTSRASHSAF